LVLEQAEREYAPAVFANSFGAEDMVLTDVIAQRFRGIGMFTLDTGRLPEETHALMQAVTERYGIKLEVFFPESRAVENYHAAHGPNAFSRSVELRRGCCYMRKVEPLKRALA